jgi:hypothetical protein
MGAACSIDDANFKKIKDLKKTYKEFHQSAQEINNKQKINKNKEEDEFNKNALKLLDHRKNFIKYKDEINITNKDLYNNLFVKKIDPSQVLEIKGIQSIDEEKVLFFVNKCNFKKIRICESSINFPKVKN